MNKYYMSVVALFLYETTFSYKISDDIITCWEHNVYDFEGYSDPMWADEDVCKGWVMGNGIAGEPEYCPNYQNEPNPNKGDVCDHQGRDVCYFNLRSGPYDEAKTYSFKCWQTELCPLAADAAGSRMGCTVNTKHVTCCCDDQDYCNGNDVFARLASNWNYRIGEENDVFWTDEEAALIVEELQAAGVRAELASEVGGGQEGGGTGQSSYGVYNVPVSELGKATIKHHSSVLNGVNQTDLLLIFSFFVIAGMCMLIGLFIGSKLNIKTSTIPPPKQINDL